jgi:hypothetical protein
MELRIKENEWKPISGPGELKPGDPYWLKLANGNIVLSMYLGTEFTSGWVKLVIDEDSVIKIQHNHYYAVKDAFIQPAVREDKCLE